MRDTGTEMQHALYAIDRAIAKPEVCGRTTRGAVEVGVAYALPLWLASDRFSVCSMRQFVAWIVTVLCH